MQSRAIRRHHERRVKCRTRQYYGGYARHDLRASGKHAQCRTPCSYWMCGNPRRYTGEPTPQERRLNAADAVNGEAPFHGIPSRRDLL